MALKIKWMITRPGIKTADAVEALVAETSNGGLYLKGTIQSSSEVVAIYQAGQWDKVEKVYITD